MAQGLTKQGLAPLINVPRRRLAAGGHGHGGVTRRRRSRPSIDAPRAPEDSPCPRTSTGAGEGHREAPEVGRRRVRRRRSHGRGRRDDTERGTTRPWAPCTPGDSRNLTDNKRRTEGHGAELYVGHGGGHRRLSWWKWLEEEREAARRGEMLTRRW